ncbi:MAG: S8 family serine peptidase [Nitrospirota bacterium]
MSGFALSRLVGLVAALGALLSAAAPPAWAGRIAPEVDGALRAKPPGARHRVIVRLPGAPALDESALHGRSKAFRSRAVVGALRSIEREQRPVIETLKGHRAVGNVDRLRSLWIANAVAVEASENTLRDLAAAYPDLEIVEDRPIRLLAATSNLTQVKAPDVWALSPQGYTGEGVVIAIVDTGVDGAHPALSTRYRRGSNGWFDAFDEHATPFDANGHGTAVAGIAVGGDASGSAIGVAPGARWIAAKIFSDNPTAQAFESDAAAGLQWALDPDGNPSTDDGADVINGSFEVAGASAVCDANSLLRSAVTQVRNAGVVAVFASGNAGSPVVPAAYPEAMAVGAVDQNDVLYVFSGQGTTACRPTSVYPDLVAPGVAVTSADTTLGGATPGSPVQSVTGTSFAAPHVAGAAALLLSAYPHLSVNSIVAALSMSAVDLGIAGSDDQFGAGRLDTLGALNYVKQNLPAPPAGAEVKQLGGALGVMWLPSPTTMVSSYSVSRNGAVLATGVTGSSYDDSSASTSASYTYTVSAVKNGIASDVADAMLANISRGETLTTDRVDGFDLVVLQAAMGSAPGMANWNPAADLNGDGLVNSADFAILSTHFGQVMK